MDKDKALFHLQKAVDNISEDKAMKKQNAPLEAYYYLGKAYQLNYKYNEALVEVRTNEIINAFISERAAALEKALPPVVKVATKSGEVKKDKS